MMLEWLYLLTEWQEDLHFLNQIEFSDPSVSCSAVAFIPSNQPDQIQDRYKNVYFEEVVLYLYMIWLAHPFMPSFRHAKFSSRFPN